MNRFLIVAVLVSLMITSEQASAVGNHMKVGPSEGYTLAVATHALLQSTNFGQRLHAYTMLVEEDEGLTLHPADEYCEYEKVFQQAGRDVIVTNAVNDAFSSRASMEQKLLALRTIEILKLTEVLPLVEQNLKRVRDPYSILILTHMSIRLRQASGQSPLLISDEPRHEGLKRALVFYTDSIRRCGDICPKSATIEENFFTEPFFTQDITRDFKRDYRTFMKDPENPQVCFTGCYCNKNHEWIGSDGKPSAMPDGNPITCSPVD